jgi:glycine/D-amino acid oxidase-like deaminating enzyme
MATGRVGIIGGGITGTLSAVELRKAGWDVVLIEGAHIGAGSSSRSAAGIRQQFSSRETVLGMRYAVDYYRRFPEEVGGQGVPIVESGYLFLLGDAAAVSAAADRVQTQRAAGLAEVELLDGAEALRRFPWISPERVVGATFCPSDGFLRPEVVFGEAAASARARGVTVLQRAPVLAARHQGGRLRAVQAGAEWIEADLFVDATNAWSPRLGRILEGTALRVDPIKRYLWFLGRGEAQTAEGLRGMPMVISPEGVYCRPENSDTWLMGWAHDAPPEPDFSDEDQDRIEADFDPRSGVDGRPYAAWAALAESLPSLEHASGFQATTAGFYGVTPDHNPFIDHDPRVEGLIRAVGFSGHGAMFGPFTARLVTALAEAGRRLEQIELLGQAAEVGAFHIGRDFENAEHMVI